MLCAHAVLGLVEQISTALTAELTADSGSYVRQSRFRSLQFINQFSGWTELGLPKCTCAIVVVMIYPAS